VPRKNENARKDLRQVSSYIGSSFPAVWENVLLPWFKGVARAALEIQEPVVVVIASRAQADFLRKQLLARGVALLGVKFLTPPQLRELLLRRSTLKLPLREHLRLLLAITADELANKSKDSSTQTSVAKSIARDPDNFLRAFDQLRAAGCELNELEPPILRELATTFEKRVHRSGFTLVHEADRFLVETANEAAIEFGELLVSDFDGAHWPLWPLLRATVRRSRRATVLLKNPRDEARDLDEAWIGTWEEHFGETDMTSSLPNETIAFSELTQPLESAAAVTERKSEPLPHVHFLMGRDAEEQARAIAAVALSFLNESTCESVGILLPGPGALARLVAQALDALAIPHNDSIAHAMRGTFDNEEWRAWLELQRRPQLGPLLRFLNHSSAAVEFFPKLSLREIQRTLRRACGDVLINDVHVLTEYCSRTNDPKVLAVSHGLRAIRFLPARAELEQFLKATLSIFRELKWRERAAELERLSRGWSGTLIGTFSRQHFLRWLTELFAESALCRNSHGEHPYAGVQLLRHDQAENRTWSYLILGGLNEGQWPKRDDESPFLGEEQVAALNESLRNLNKRAKKEGSFGSGQTIVREGATLCLGSRERRDLALRQLLNAIESTTNEIAVTAQLYITSPREQAINPSDFFARLFFNARGEALSQREIERIHARTVDWLARIDLVPETKPDIADLDQTAVAYQARRRHEQPFSEYEFAFRKNLPPSKQISLSATDAARLFTSPALVWMKNFLRVESEEGDVVSWNLATGQWVHRWLATVADESTEERFVPKPSANAIIARVESAAEKFRDEMVAIVSAAGERSMPDWWLSGWRNARYLAERFARELGRSGDWPELATEWILDSPQIIKLDDRHELHVRGRVDLVLARSNASANELWIVDYKTGLATALKPRRTALRKQFTEGNGVQICIYALAFRELGWRDVYVSLLTRETDLEQPQANLSDVEAQAEIWREIARMEETGIFGMLGELRSKYTFTGIYPLATLAIDKDFLREKWRRTHPSFAAEEATE
jgi:PD-(D/E)XK nuclease superfamily protein